MSGFVLTPLLLAAAVIVIYRWIAKRQFGSLPSATELEGLRRSPHFNPTTGKFQNYVPQGPDQQIAMGRVFRQMLTGKQRRKPSQPLPSQKPDLATFMKKDEVRLKWLWLGHSTFLLNFDGTVILIDPVLSSAAPFSFAVRRFAEPVLTFDQMPPIDLVLVSHDHYDHLDANVARDLARLRMPIIVPLGLKSRLMSFGIAADRIRELDWHESTALGALDIIATPAQHFSGRGIGDKDKTLWAGYLIRSEGMKIYYSGDSGYGPHFKEIGDRYGPIDLAFLECGQYNRNWQYVHMLPEETLQAALDVKAKNISPVHWGMFVLAFHDWFEPIETIYNLATQQKLPLWHPEVGEIVRFLDSPPIHLWWREHPDFKNAKT